MSFQRTEKQQEATKLLTSCTYPLLVGGSRSGKTFIKVRSLVIRTLKAHSRHLIVRQRLNHLMSSIWHDTFPKVMDVCFPQLVEGVHFKYYRKDGMVNFKANDSEIWFAGTDDKKRTEKLLGHEYSTIYANEASQMSYEDAFTVLMTRLAEQSGLPLRFYVDCNPPAKSHWIYKLWVEHVDPLTGEPKNPDMYKYLLMNPMDNVQNLAPGYIESFLDNLPKNARDRFKYGIFVNDTEGALWSADLLSRCIDDAASFEELKQRVKIVKVLIGLDPSTTAKENSDLCGIVVIAVDVMGIIYVVGDYSLKATPIEWASKVVYVYNLFQANSVVVEVNQGGDMCKTILYAAGFYGDTIEVRASVSKHCRAEPVLALYEMGRVKHLNNDTLRHLEDEMTTYVPLMTKKSPDRLDANVWAISSVMDELSEIKAFGTINFAEIAKMAARRW